MFSHATAADLLRQGLVVLKQGNVAEAIAQLEALTRSTTDRAIQLKAQMGLVKAYEQQGNVERAIALCQKIQASPSKQAQQWALQTLTTLNRSQHNPTEPAPATSQGDSTLHCSETVPASKPQAASKTAPNPALLHGELLQESDRAQRWTPLKRLDRSPLWAACAGTIVLLVLLLRILLLIARHLFNEFVIRFPFPFFDLRSFYIQRDPTAIAILITLALVAAVPWGLPYLLRRVYRLQTLRLEDLETSSPEAVRVLHQAFRHAGGIPQLGIFPISAPLIFSCGLLPKQALIVVSRGLLQQLTAQEIATLIAAEVGHIQSFDFIALSVVTLATQLPYLAYARLADWGDSLRAARSKNREMRWLSRAIAILLSTLCYGTYACLRWSGLLLSRLRVYYSDRYAVDLTGNPNALTRALLKLMLGIAQDLENQKQTRPLLQSVDLLLPIGPQLALTPGSMLLRHPQPQQLERWLAWEQHNPYRHLLAFNNAHPLLGDRLSRLTEYARHWRLPPQLSLPPRSPASPLSLPITRALLLQVAPLLGLLGGWAIALLLWGVGAIAMKIGWLELDWLWQDTALLRGFLLIGPSVGLLLRINALFPDIQPGNLQNPSLAQLLSVPSAIPVEGQPVCLHGVLLGQRGTRNQFSQDLFLQSEEGCIRLNYIPPLGPIAALLPQTPLPVDLLQRTVTVTGWFRRGATVWIDVETIRPQSAKALSGGHPVWATAIAVVLMLLGAWTIIQGNV